MAHCAVVDARDLVFEARGKDGQKDVGVATALVRRVDGYEGRDVGSHTELRDRITAVKSALRVGDDVDLFRARFGKDLLYSSRKLLRTNCDRGG